MVYKVKQLKFILWGAVVEEVRTIFEERDDESIYIPYLSEISA